MTPHQLRCAFEEYYGKYQPSAGDIFEEKMAKFSPSQLSSLYDKVLETHRYKYPPLIANVYEAADNLGMSTRQEAPLTFADHDWTIKTDCPRCEGQGALAVFFHVVNGHRRTMAALPLKGAKTRQYEDDSREAYLAAQRNGTDQLPMYHSIARCCCLRGDVATLPGGWPKLGNATEPHYHVDDPGGKPEWKKAAAQMEDDDDLPF